MIVAVGIPTFILIAALALEFGNWYAQKRSVQNQVDAAAFAAGVAYGYNFPTCVTSSSASGNITNSAVQYGSPPLNGKSNAVTANADPCVPHGTGDYASPPQTMWTQVSVKESVPSLFGGFGIVPTISASARVAVMQLRSMTGFRPLSIANPAIRPTSARGRSSRTRATHQSSPWRARRRRPLARQRTSPFTRERAFRVNVRIGDCTDPSRRITYRRRRLHRRRTTRACTGAGTPGICSSRANGPDCGSASTMLAISRGRPAAATSSRPSSASTGRTTSHRRSPPTSTVTSRSPARLRATRWQGTVPGVPTAWLVRQGRRHHPRRACEATLTSTTGPARGTQIDTTTLRPRPAVMAGNDRHVGPIATFTLSQRRRRTATRPSRRTIDLVA